MVMKGHSTFSTTLIAKKCFQAKVRPDEYHFGAGGKPTTLKELTEKVDKDIPTADHFKKVYGDMFKRMKDFLKPEFEAEIDKMINEIEEMLEETVKKKPPAAKKKANGAKNKKQETRRWTLTA